MEKCLHVKPSRSDFALRNDLLENLLCLHEMQIVHRDIKPENIMYSPTKNRAVFIDFGMSKLLTEKIGELSSTQFVGTYMLACPEMQTLYHNQCCGLIDLYYNDAYALELSLKYIGKSSEDESLIFSNFFIASKWESDPIIDSIYIGAEFIEALHFSSLPSLLSILSRYPAYHQLFLYLFSVYCQQELEINSVTHPYYEALKRFEA